MKRWLLRLGIILLALLGSGVLALSCVRGDPAPNWGPTSGQLTEGALSHDGLDSDLEASSSDDDALTAPRSHHSAAPAARTGDKRPRSDDEDEDEQRPQQRMRDEKDELQTAAATEREAERRLGGMTVPDDRRTIFSGFRLRHPANDMRSKTVL